MVASQGAAMTVNRGIDQTKLVFQYSTFQYIHPNTVNALRKLTLDPYSGMSCEINLRRPNAEVMLCRYGSRNKIIAWTIKDQYANIQLFVKPEYRKMGLGTLLTKAFLEQVKVKHFYRHDYASSQFWNKMKQGTKLTSCPHPYW